MERDMMDLPLIPGKKNYGIRVSAYIRQNYKTPLLLEEVAAHFQLNKCYFCSVLKKELGKTFSQLVNEVRIEKSKELLLENRLSILDIALAVGFNNQNYFNMAFKKLTGMTPLTFRRVRGDTSKKMTA
ncbi:MAG: AraC family transcriptional regulator [Turicibacter sp.]|nr:AraC family transcriptional regulator [Turicibacter sp.]